MLVSVILFLLTAIYVVVWIACLIDCLRRKEFYPIFGKTWGTKLFWLVTFVFFNPILTVLYIVFGIVASSERKPGILPSAVALAPVLVVILVMEINWSRPGGEAVVMERNPETGQMEVVEGDRNSVEVKVAVNMAGTSMNTSTAKMSSPNAQFACRRILILTQSRKPFLSKLGLELQDQLTALPWVEEIAFYPAGNEPPEGRRSFDVILLLELAKYSEIDLRLFRSVSADVQIHAGTALYENQSQLWNDISPKIRMSFNGTVDLKSWTVGYVSSPAEHTYAAKHAAQQIAGNLQKTFNGYIDEHGLLGDLPESLYGPYREPPDLPFLPDESSDPLLAAYGLLNHCRAVWQYDEDRPTSDAMRAVIETMEGAGWEVSRFDEHPGHYALWMTTGTQRFTVFPKPLPAMMSRIVIEGNDKPKKPARPMVVVYQDDFSEPETETAMENLLDSDVPTETLLAFSKYQRDGHFRDRLLERLESRKPQSAEAYVTLAQIYDEEDEQEKARQALLHARAYSYAAPGDQSVENEIKRLAKQIGEEELADSTPPPEAFREVGFVELTTSTEPVECTVGLRERVAVFTLQEKDRQPIVASAQIVRAVNEKDGPHYALEYVLSRGGSWSSGSTGNGVIDGKWNAMTSTAIENLSVWIEAEKVGPDRFRIQFRRQ